MLTIDLLLTAAVFGWIYFLWSRRRYYLVMLKLPGPIGFPLLGVALHLFFYKLRLSAITMMFNIYGSTVFTWIGPLPVLATRDPKIVEDILTSPVCINRSKHAADAIVANCGQGVLTLPEPKWSERRKLLNPCFKQNVLLSFFPIFNAETNVLLTLLDSYVGEGEKELLSDVLKWSFRISFQTTVGADIQQEESFNSDLLLECFQTSLKLITLNVVVPFTQIGVIAKLCGIEKNISTMHSMLDSIIRIKLSSKKESNSETELNLVIDQVIDSYRTGKMSWEDMQGEISIMVIGAFETTGLTVYHALVLLAMHPEFQDTVHEELNEVFPTPGDFEVAYEDLQKLVYLERVVKETLRLIPAIPLDPREISKDFRLSSGAIIPKGVMAVVDVFNTHRNPEVWGPDATKFNPDNFLPDNVSARHPYAFIPFSKGKRNCIGWRYGLMSSKLALAKILRNFKVSTTFSYEDLQFVENIGMKLTETPRLAFERRT
ncbi:probable cytochrome P450 313a3 [Drosophila kikkawai]|uniref:Probable cytochrome P450 313a3 n=1 Tax=Drosophila kikkawai TaxID=30033 RepID=A0A6P4IQ58_DROKI|nr:probable cytochrome P450 313a3 [Drosophila kikkawai]